MTGAPPGGSGSDYDVLVVGSGFGGSVTALRLAEKGYRVHVVESGRRFRDEDFAKTSWDLRSYLWAPKLKCFGVQRVHRLPDVMILAGAGVGGGSLNYANTLYVPPAAFFADRQWGDITDWQAELAPHYDTASTMLGVVTNPCEGVVEDVMRQTAEDLGVGDTFRKAPTGVFYGMPGKRVPDPYFGGAGPDRTGCTECGNCMVGCRVGAKNTLVKNYLALAEKLGVTIEPMRTVVRVAPRRSGGYAVTHEASGAWFRRARHTVTADQVVFAAGTWGTQKLLHSMRQTGVLPGLSARLGHLTRTNSEAVNGVMLEKVKPGLDLSHGVAITSSFHPDADTHVENVRYGRGSNAMGLLATILVPGGELPRPAQFVVEVVRHPVVFLRSLSQYRWSERTVIGLIMQSRDNSLHVNGTSGLFGGRGLTSRQGHGEPNPTYIPAGQEAMKALAVRLSAATGLRAFAGSSVSEIANIPLTAHFLGGVTIGSSPERGVLDPYQRVWGYPDLHVVDGSAVSANLGVNPSLTITAQAERAMSLWPNKGEADPRPAQGAAYRRLEAVKAGHPAVTRYTHESARV
ncbi:MULTISPECIES: GMC oxidoreductase [unclassified Phycicoccus]|uniref:GMC oxidoreductase n=1 Tax=unclassified Phycicoccus TaxID=2637926 RepID=UPI00070313F8|nr:MULTISPECIES: GMC family oxidoreductase [unclassified Phycicoccus]KRF23969.1 cholesterol oxidase [Phycicoccus sp. Soil803]KRF27374.1 cholesterol oxidase [Phycicoccus sp. Soil802]